MADAHTLEVTRFPVAELHTYHRNPRVGNVAAIRQSLRVNSQYKPIVVNAGTYTGRPNEVLAGNHTLIGAREEGWETIQGVTVDVDEDQAGRIVAADNRTSDLGSYDDRLLAELLEDLPDLDGTGYDPGDLDDLRAKLEELADPATGGSPDDNVQQFKSLEEKYDSYETSDKRIVLLAYEGAQYVWVVDKLADLGKQYGVDTNAECVLKLIEAATSDHAPEP